MPSNHNAAIRARQKAASQDPTEALLSRDTLAIQIRIREQMKQKSGISGAVGKQMIGFTEAMEDDNRMQQIGVMRACAKAKRAVEKLEQEVANAGPLGGKTISMTKHTLKEMELSKEMAKVDLTDLSSRLLADPMSSELEYTEEEERMLTELMKRKEV